MDQRSFIIIILLTTVISYVFIRKYFKMNPKYLVYAVIGMFFGLTIGVSIAWPFTIVLAKYGIIVAPYIMGMVLLAFIEFFVIEGSDFVKHLKRKVD